MPVRELDESPGPLIHGAGTAESAWSGWAVLDALPRLDVSAAGIGGGPLVVAPHPDDEVLGCGGLLAVAGGEVVAVTDGEASHPGSRRYAVGELVSLRRAETARALAVLGRPATAVHRLGHPDGGVDEARLAGELERWLVPGRWCVSPWAGDGHPDHEAAGRAARTACLRSGARLVEYPVWAWHWAAPADPRVPWESGARLDLDPRTAAAKRAAIDCFESQTRPLGPDPADGAVLPPAVVARFTRPFETFLVPPAAAAGLR